MRVRFEEPETPKTESSEEVTEEPMVEPGNVGLRTNRRVSRGPEGQAYRIPHPDSDDDSDKGDAESNHSSRTPTSPDPNDNQQPEGATGSLFGGIKGAIKGAAYGGAVGGAYGFVPAVFTFGLSIPVGALLGAGAMARDGWMEGSGQTSSHTQLPQARRNRSPESGRSSRARTSSRRKQDRKSSSPVGRRMRKNASTPNL